MLANADDAGATEVAFCLDRTQGPTNSVFAERMEGLQGPAILSFNNAVMTEQDVANIQNIGASMKAKDFSKVGRFGLGFNSVYHVTDVPRLAAPRGILLAV